MRLYVLFMCLSAMLIVSNDLIAQTEPAMMNDNDLPVAVKGLKEKYEKGLALMKDKHRAEALVIFQEVMSAPAELRKNQQARVIVSCAADNAGSLLLIDGKVSEAEDAYRLAVTNDPKHALALNNLGVVLLKQGKLREAMRSFEQAVKVDPRQGMALNNLSSLLMHTGEFKRAAKTLATALKLNPRNEQTLLQMAELYARIGKPEMQPKIWDALVKTTDGSLKERLRLGSWYLQANILSQAETVFKQLLREHSDWPEARLQLARLNALKGNKLMAVKELRVLLPLLPDEPGVRNDLAVLLLNDNHIKEARKLASESVQVFPNVAKGWFVLGCVNERLDRTGEAEKNYFKAVKLDRGCVDAWNNLGVLTAKKGDVNTALTCYVAALFADPYSVEAQYNLGRSLVIGKKDYERGVRLLMRAAAGKGEAADRAKRFVADLEKIAEGGDPHWGKKKVQVENKR